jgi:hypothetical protein
MKKFGTPIGAGPGSDSENVGLVAEGTPLPVGSLVVGVLEVCGLLFLCAFFLPPWEEAPSLLLVPVGSGVLVVEPVVVVDDDVVVGLCEGEVEVEVEVEPGELDELVDEVGLEVVDVVVVVVLVVTLTEGAVEVDGAHCSLSETTTPLIGSPIAEIGVPGGTLTLKVNVWPPTTVTVTVQASAEAVGIDARAMATNNAPAIARTASSLRRAIMADLLLQLPRRCELQWNNGTDPRRLPRTLPTGPERCNREPGPAAI